MIFLFYKPYDQLDIVGKGGVGKYIDNRQFTENLDIKYNTNY